MRVLHLSNTPLSNAPANTVAALNAIGHQAELFLDRQQNTNKVFVGGQLWYQTPPGALEQAFVSADVIHFHNFAFEQKIFKSEIGPRLESIAKSKPCLIQYHSPRHSTESFEVTTKDPFFDGRRAVLAQYHVRFYPEATHVLPNILPINDKQYTPILAKWDTDSCLVSFAPSNTNLRGWDDKGYDFIAPVLTKLEQSGIITKDIIVNTPYQECLNRKRWAHIGIEELITGSYHLSFLEYMSAGCVTLHNMDELTLNAMQMIVGEQGIEELPAIQANITNVSEIVTKLARYSGLADTGNQSRAWMEKFWNPDVLAAKLVKIYEEL